MRTAIDDFPCVSASRLRALGEIRSDMKTVAIRFPAGDTFTVALQHIRFPNGGGWSFFQCPCGRLARTIRLCDGAVACKHCLEARGLRYRVEDLSRPERAAHVAARLASRLASDGHARLKPHLRYSTLERRGRLEANLRRCEFTAARHDFRDLIGKDGG
jgi:hypothetical protein